MGKRLACRKSHLISSRSCHLSGRRTVRGHWTTTATWGSVTCCLQNCFSLFFSFVLSLFWKFDEMKIMKCWHYLLRSGGGRSSGSGQRPWSLEEGEETARVSWPTWLSCVVQMFELVLKACFGIDLFGMVWRFVWFLEFLFLFNFKLKKLFTRSVSIELAAFAISNLNRFTFPRFAKSHKTHENKFPIKWSARYWSTIDFRNSKGLGCRTGHQRFQSHQELSLKFPKPKEQGRGRLFEQHFPTLQQHQDLHMSDISMCAIAVGWCW